MKHRKAAGLIFFVVALTLALGLTLAGQVSEPAASLPAGAGQSQGGAPPAAGAQAAPAPQQPPAEPAEAVYKNIQVLKGIPAAQLIPTMNFMAGSLGVQCNFCHLPNQFEKDDKNEKQTARKMIAMMQAINKDHFNGRRQVTCNSCHNGHAQPAPIPAVAQGLQPGAERPAPGGPGGPGGEGRRGGIGAPGAPAATPPPTVDQILAKYVEGIGGAATVEKVESRAEKGNLIAPNGMRIPIEAYQKAPNKQIIILHTPSGDAVQAFDGEVLWTQNPGGRMEEPTPAQFARTKRTADLHRALHLKEQYARIRLGRMEKVGDRDAYLVIAAPQGEPFERLYFDAQTGLLLRTVTLEDTPLGANPTQTDYDDYRDVDGLKIAFRVRISRTDNVLVFQFDDIKQNVPVDDAKFTKPAAK